MVKRRRKKGLRGFLVRQKEGTIVGGFLGIVFLVISLIFEMSAQNFLVKLMIPILFFPELIGFSGISFAMIIISNVLFWAFIGGVVDSIWKPSK